MSDFGLSPREITLIRGALERCPGLEEAWIFGSRALGRERPSSDVDLAAFGTLGREELAALRSALDELPLPYLFDVTLFSAIEHEPLREHIRRVGRVFYRKGEGLPDG